jgi:hypothetical protein
MLNGFDVVLEFASGKLTLNDAQLGALLADQGFRVCGPALRRAS